MTPSSEVAALPLPPIHWDLFPTTLVSRSLNIPDAYEVELSRPSP